MDFEVLVGDPWFMDMDVLYESYIWWLDGVSAEDAVQRQLDKFRANATRQLNHISKTENTEYADVSLHANEMEPMFPLLHRNMVDQWRFFQVKKYK
jgi:ssDNA-binding replication factor A large subunit